MKTEAKAARLEAETKARAETEAKRIARLKTVGKKQECDRSPQGAFCAAMCAALTHHHWCSCGGRKGASSRDPFPLRRRLACDPSHSFRLARRRVVNSFFQARLEEYKAYTAADEAKAAARIAALTAEGAERIAARAAMLERIVRVI